MFVLNKQGDDDLAKLALTCAALQVPSTSEKNWWLLQRRLLQHAIRQTLFIADGKVDIVGLDRAFHNLGDLYANQGKLVDAEKMCVRALQGFEKGLGVELMPSSLPALNTMIAYGDVYSKTNRKSMAKGVCI